MSVNRNKTHLLVLPEDDANRQVANGFQQRIDLIRQRQMQVLPVAGGWNEVLNRFKSDHITNMYRYSDRLIVLLIDFDRQRDRLQIAKDAIPDDLKDRVFILGTLSEPEDLKAIFGPYEAIGSTMADDCQEETDKADEIWEHNLLQHNKIELDRLRERVHTILFPSN